MTGHPTVDGARSDADDTSGDALMDAASGAADARTSPAGHDDGTLTGTIGGVTDTRTDDTGATNGALTGAAGGSDGARARIIGAADGAIISADEWECRSEQLRCCHAEELPTPVWQGLG